MQHTMIIAPSDGPAESASASKPKSGSDDWGFTLRHVDHFLKKRVPLKPPRKVQPLFMRGVSDGFKVLLANSVASGIAWQVPALKSDTLELIAEESLFAHFGCVEDYVQQVEFVDEIHREAERHNEVSSESFEALFGHFLVVGKTIPDLESLLRRMVELQVSFSPSQIDHLLKVATSKEDISIEPTTLYSWLVVKFCDYHSRTAGNEGVALSGLMAKYFEVLLNLLREKGKYGEMTEVVHIMFGFGLPLSEEKVNLFREININDEERNLLRTNAARRGLYFP
jgi:hypothetical protein